MHIHFNKITGTELTVYISYTGYKKDDMNITMYELYENTFV